MGEKENATKEHPALVNRLEAWRSNNAKKQAEKAKRQARQAEKGARKRKRVNSEKVLSESPVRVNTRVKVMYDDEDWYTGVIEKVTQGGRRVTVRFDADGTALEAPFPGEGDDEIVVID